MGSLRLTLCAGAVAAAAFAPTAYAVDGAGVSLTPGSPAPGTDIHLLVRGCPGTTGTAASDAFVAAARLVGQDGTLSGDTRVRTTLAPGSYAVTVDCDDQQVKGTVTVSGPAASAGVAAMATPSAEAAPSVRASPSAQALASGAATATGRPSAASSPVAPVSAGGGGTAREQSAGARAEGPGARHAVIGLVLAGTALAVVVARRGRNAE
ncbi:hypothetical protein AB0C59_13355 [Streptomyces sp. NPDC048664]|uniref:hypothetical protein n=1 Tax=Streptomyces sp. NPDC048664 TaxID=3154505 RepID=UPI00343C16F6